MARNTTARAESTVTLNGRAAENALDGLKIKAKQYRDAILEASRAGDTAKVEKLNKALKATEGSMKSIRQQTFDYNTVLKNLNGASIVQLEKSAKALRNEIKRLSPTTEEFITKSKQLDAVKARMDDLNGRVRQSTGWLARAGDSFNRYFSLLTAAAASIAGISMALRSAAQAAAEMDDTFADVMKTTNLTREEVVLLNEEFKKLDTRTSREALNLLARDAGKLGISAAEDVMEFVRAANQINVALGEDLGEGAIRNIGKISEVFQQTKALGIEKAFLSIGSSINALGQASTASESYLVDFTQRLSGVAYQSGMSVQNILGFASALDQTGNKVEMAATAFQKFVMTMFSDTATFADMAGMSVEKFSRLLQRDTNTAIITVLKSLGEKGGFSQLVPIFEDMGLEGARAVSVLTSLASNINLVTEAQKLSNIEYRMATSLTREYNIKNDTMQARLEKAKKAFMVNVIALGEKLSPALLKTTNASTIFLKVVMLIPSWLYMIVAGVLAGVVAWKSWNIVVSAWNTLMVASRLVALALSASMAMVTGNTIRAAAAWKLFNATLSTTAIGAIVVAIGALAVGLYKVITYQSQLTKATESYYEQTQKAKLEAEGLLEIVKKSAVGSEAYKAAMDRLVELYGPYIQNLIDEKGVLTDIETARKNINDEIERSIAVKLKEEMLAEITERNLRKQKETYASLVNSIMGVAGASESAAQIQATSIVSMIKAGMDEYEIHKQRLESGLPAIGLNWIRLLKQQNKAMIQELHAATTTMSALVPSLFVKGFDPTKEDGPQVKNSSDLDAEKAMERKRLADLAAARREQAEKEFRKEMERLSIQEREKANALKIAFLKNSLSQEEYDARITQNTINFLQRRNALHIKYNQDNTEVEGQYYDAILKLASEATRKSEELLKIKERWMKKLNEYQEEEIFEPETDREIEAFAKHYKELQRSAEEIKEKYQKSSWQKQRAYEMANLQEMLREKLITQQEYEHQVKKLRLDAAVKTAEAVNSLVSSMADFYNTLRDSEFERLERQKEQELMLHGENADARAEIEQKYEKRKHELQVEYADKDMAIKIVQAIAAGALAVTQALAQLGPVAGAVAAVLIGATTAVQIGTIVAQRNALKSGAGPASSSSSKSRTVKEYYEGGYTTRRWSDREPVGVVHANEWVAPASMVRANPVVFANLERQRMNKYSILSPVKQFAGGGFTSPSRNTSKSDELLEQLVVEVRALRNKSLPAHVVLDEINAQQEIKMKFKKQGSL